MIDFLFWVGVILWSVTIIMWFCECEISWSGLFALSVCIFSGGVVIMLLLISFLYRVISSINPVI